MQPLTTVQTSPRQNVLTYPVHEPVPLQCFIINCICYTLTSLITMRAHAVHCTIDVSTSHILKDMACIVDKRITIMS